MFLGFSLNKKHALLTIIIVSLTLRLVAINQSLWLDEAIGAIAVKEYSFVQIATQFIKADNHTPLYYLLLKLWTNIFGYSEISLRAPSIIFGVATVYMTYKITLVVAKSRFFSLLSTLLLATSQFHIYYSQEARMYSMAAFFAILSVYGFIRTLHDERLMTWLIFSSSITILLFTDYVPIFIIPAYWLYAAIHIKDRGWWIKFIVSHFPLGILGLIWLPTLLTQSENYARILKIWPAWQKVAGGATIKQALLVWMKFVLGRITYPNKLYYYVLVGLASTPFLISYLKLVFTKRNKYITLIIYWLLVPLIFGYIVSIWFPAFIYFRFLYVIPAFYLLVAWAVDTFTVKPLKKYLSVLMVGINMFGWITYVTDDDQQREQWRQAVAFVEANAEENEIALFEFPEPFAPYRWYESGKVEAVGATNSVSAGITETKNITKSAVKDKKGVYYFEYLQDLSDPEGVVTQTLKDEGFTVGEVFNFKGVGQVFYYNKAL